MASTGRLIGGPSDGQTFVMETERVEYIDHSEPGDHPDVTSYIYIGTDTETGEHLFRWDGNP